MYIDEDTNIVYVHVMSLGQINGQLTIPSLPALDLLLIVLVLIPYRVEKPAVEEAYLL